MIKEAKSGSSGDEIEINLKDPVLAGFWAWLWPGAGHIYQGRYAKGALFMICILGTFFAGLAIGGRHVVYASWTQEDKRLPYLCQVGVGLPALPALVQMYRANRGDSGSIWHGFMAPPKAESPSHLDPAADEKSAWLEKYAFRWDMGELYTMIAGLLNVLAIFDAAAGPVLPPADEEPPLDGEEEPKTTGDGD